MNKGIIVIGSVGSGKTTLIDDIEETTPNLSNLYYINQDILVENPASEYYNNPLSASRFLYDQWLPDIKLNNYDFILDITGANIKTLHKIIDTNYQYKVILLYCNPIISFIRNFSRDRKVPQYVVLENWLKVYSQLEEYQDIFGKDNIYIYETDYSSQEKIYLEWYPSIREVLDNNPGAYYSTFKKENKKYTKEEELIREEKIKLLIENVNQNFQKINQNIQSNKNPLEFIKEELNKWII